MKIKFSRILKTIFLSEFVKGLVSCFLFICLKKEQQLITHLKKVLLVQDLGVNMH